MTTFSKPRRGRKPGAEVQAANPTLAAPPPPEPSPPAPVPTQPDLPKGKLGVMVGLLRRPEGARIADLSAATGWLTHSVRGAMSGALKARGYGITSAPDPKGCVYRIAASEAAG